MVYYFQNCSDLLWEKNGMVIKKNLWNSKLKAKNLKIFEKSDPLYIIQIKKKLRFRNLQEKLEKYSVSIVLTFQFSDWFFLVILKVLIKFFSITKSLKKFVGFLVETMTAKRHFEINWPLEAKLLPSNDLKGDSMNLTLLYNYVVESFFS